MSEAPGRDLDGCAFLLCPLENDGVRRLLERNKIDPTASPPASSPLVVRWQRH